MEEVNSSIEELRLHHYKYNPKLMKKVNSSFEELRLHHYKYNPKVPFEGSSKPQQQLQNRANPSTVLLAENYKKPIMEATKDGAGGEAKAPEKNSMPFGRPITGLENTSKPFDCAVPTTTSTGSGGLFASTTTSTTTPVVSTSSLFGTTTSTGGSTFAFNPTATTTRADIFGRFTTTTTTPTTVSTGELFRTSLVTGGGLFAPTTTSTTTGGLFAPTTTSTKTGGLFAPTTTTTTTQSWPGGVFSFSPEWTPTKFSKERTPTKSCTGCFTTSSKPPQKKEASGFNIDTLTANVPRPISCQYDHFKIPFNHLNDNSDEQMCLSQSYTLEEIKKLVAASTILSKQCFILKDTSFFNSLQFCPSSVVSPAQNLEKTLCSVFGEENIQNIEFMGEKQLLVTLTDQDKLEGIVASVYKIWTSDHIHLEIVPVAPVPARVCISIKGIPRLLTTELKSDFLNAVGVVLPVLSKLSIEGDCSGRVCIGVVVEGLTADLITTKEQLNQGQCSVVFRGFTGIVKYQSAKPVKVKDFTPGTDKGVFFCGW